MNITTIKKELKQFDATKDIKVLKTKERGQYRLSLENKNICYINIKDNKIYSLNLICCETNEKIFSGLYYLINEDVKININNKEYNFFQCEKKYGFLDYLIKEDKEKTLNLINNNYKIINSIKSKLKNSNIKLKELIKNGYTDLDCQSIKEEIKYFKKRLKNKEEWSNVLKDIYKEIKE